MSLAGSISRHPRITAALTPWDPEVIKECSLEPGNAPPVQSSEWQPPARTVSKNGDPTLALVLQQGQFLGQCVDPVEAGISMTTQGLPVARLLWKLATIKRLNCGGSTHRTADPIGSVPQQAEGVGGFHCFVQANVAEGLFDHFTVARVSLDFEQGHIQFFCRLISCGRVLLHR